MSSTQQEDSGEMNDCQLKFLQSLSALLSEHQEVLPTLPKMCERFITAQANVPKEPNYNSNFDLSREDEKTVLAKRKRGELSQVFKEKLAQKDERIAYLENKLDEEKKVWEGTLSDKDKDFESLLSHYKTFEQQSKSNHEKYMEELRAKEKELEESRKRAASLETELKSKDVVSTMTRVNSLENQPTSKQTALPMTELKQMERDYQAEISEKDNELKKLRQSFNQMEEYYKSVISAKDEELNKLKYSVEGQKASKRFEKVEREYQAIISERDEELNKQKHSFNQMEEHYKSVISAKDEELDKSRYSFHQIEESLNTQIRSKHEELSQVQCSFTQLQEKANSIISDRDEELKQIKCRMKQLKEKCQALLESKDEELKDVKIRLAHLSEKLTKKDQRKIEDTTAANRPSEVEQDYREFFDNERMDAIEKMQKVYGSEEVNDIGISYPRLACMIFEAAYEQTLEVKESALHVFKEIINDMIDRAPKLGSEHSSADKDKILPYRVTFRVSAYSQELKYPTEVLDALELSLKETAQLCNLESMEMGVRRKITEKWISWLNSEKSCQFSFSDRMLIHLKDYVRACLRLTWRMAVQVPPMQLEYKCTTLKNFHRMVGYHSGPEMCSMPPPNGQGAADYEVACYLWPALLDGGGRVIRPGEVLCKVEAEVI